MQRLWLMMGDVRRGGRRRRPCAAQWLALVAVLCTVSLYSVEATHFHHTLAEQLACPAGHAVGHSPANLFTPEFAADLPAWHRALAPVVPVADAPPGPLPYFLPPSHAPPAPIA